MDERLNLIDTMADSMRNILIGDDIDRIEDINTIVNNEGGSIQEDDKITRSCIVKSGEAFTIKLSPKLNERQKRLWIAFELGNLFINMGYRVNNDKFNEYEDATIYKNETQYEDEISLLFAIAFIVPKRSFILKMKENYEGDGIYDIQSVADYFNIEKNVIVVRGRNLGLLAKGEHV